MGYIILFIIGLLFLRGHDVLSKVVGVVCICFALNPFIHALTGSSIVGNVSKAVKVGDKGFDTTTHALTKARQKVQGKLKDNGD